MSYAFTPADRERLSDLIEFDVYEGGSPAEQTRHWSVDQLLSHITEGACTTYTDLTPYDQSWLMGNAAPCKDCGCWCTVYGNVNNLAQCNRCAELFVW